MDHNFFIYMYSTGYKNKASSGLDHEHRERSSYFISTAELGKSYSVMDWRNVDWLFVFAVEQMDKRRFWIWR